MGKKNKNKDVSRLRAEVEFLRAQLKNSGGLSERPLVITGVVSDKVPEGAFNVRPPSSSKTTITYRIEPGQLRSDLKKTFFLTVISLAFLFSLYFSQPFLPTFVASINQAIINSPLKIPAIK
ncbi:MAG: hypothetical protein AAB486_01810 [Patescibacteria group bacterium]